MAISIACCIGHTGWLMCIFRAGHINLTGFHPVTLDLIGRIRRFIDRIVHPTVPFRRNARCLNITIIQHPASGFAVNGRAIFIFVIAIALPINADQLAAAARITNMPNVWSFHQVNSILKIASSNCSSFMPRQ